MAGSARTPIAVTPIGMIGDGDECRRRGASKSTGLMGPGVDPHLYKASEGDVIRLGEADVVFYRPIWKQADEPRL